MISNYETLSASNQKNRLKFLFKDSAIYGIAGAINKLMVLITFPIIVRFFSKEVFGQIDAINYLIALVLPLSILGIDSAVARFFYDDHTEKEKKIIISEGFYALMIITSLFSILLFFNVEVILNKYVGSEVYKNLFKILIIGLPFRAILGFNLGLCKWMLQRNKFLWLSLGSSFLVVIVTLFFLQFTKVGALAIGYGYIIGYVFFALVSIIMIKDSLVFPVKFLHIKKLIAFGSPYGISAFVSVFILSTDRFVIANYVNNSTIALANYAVAFKLASLVTIIMLGFQTAWGPFALNLHKTKDANKTYNLSLKVFVIFVSVFAVGLCSFSRLFIQIFATDKYVDSYFLVAPILFGFIFEAIAQIACIGIELSKKTYFYVVANLVSWLFAFVCMIGLSEYFNELGVAFGFLLLKFFFSTLVIYISFRVYPSIRFSFSMPSLMISISFFYILSIFYVLSLKKYSLLSDLITGLLSVGLFCLFVWFFILKKMLPNNYRLLSFFKKNSN